MNNNNNNTEGVIMRKDNIKYEIKDGRITEYHDGDRPMGSSSLYETIVFLQRKQDLDFHNKMFNEWVVENTGISSLVPEFLELTHNYDNDDYNFGMYLNKGIMIMELVFEKPYRNSHRLLKEHTILSLNDRVKNGGLTPHPFSKMIPKWCEKNECYTSLKVEGDPLTDILELYERFSNKDYDYLTDYYLEHFSLNKYVVVDGREVV